MTSMFEYKDGEIDNTPGYVHSCIFKDVEASGPRPHFSFETSENSKGIGRLKMYGLAIMPIEQAVSLNHVPVIFRWIVRRWCVGRMQ